MTSRASFPQPQAEWPLDERWCKNKYDNQGVAPRITIKSNDIYIYIPV